MVSLKDALKSLKTPKPVDFDPEDFERRNPDSDGGSDNETEFDRKQREEEKKLARAHYVDVGKSKLRSKNDAAVELNETRYKGARVSRRDLYKNEDSEDDEQSEEDSGEDESQDEGDENDDEDEEEEDDDEDNDDEDEQDNDDEEDNDDDEDDQSDEEEYTQNTQIGEKKRSQLKELLKNEQQKLVSQISKTAKDEAQKGEGIKNQIKIYETILDSRIKIQKGLVAVNSLPLTQAGAKKYSSKSTPKLLEQVASSLYSLLDQIAELRKQMMVKDSIIPEDEESDVDVKAGKRSLEAAFGNEQVLAKRLKPYSDAVLTKWSKKVQAASGVSALNASKFSIKNTNAQVQVASHLADMDRLINRTRINRSQVKILGEGEDAEEATGGNGEGEEKEDEELDEKTKIKKRIEEQKRQKKLKQQQIQSQKKKQKESESEHVTSTDQELKEREEIYDDMDFYRALLKDLVDRRMADSSVASSVKWTITKSNGHDKEKSEDKFSKDRKLKFNVQEKLQNFDAPRNTIQWSDEQIDELFSGLFGQKIEVSEAEDESEADEAEDDYIVNDGLKIFG